MNTKIEVVKGDITSLLVDAIVNAANRSLMGGGGVDGAIHRAIGPAILEACRLIVANHGECETGEAVITTAGRLPARYVIHTVGPIWQGGRNDEEEKLSLYYANSLKLALAHRCQTIAFPNISTGVYGFPKEPAAEIAIRSVKNFLQEQKMESVFFVCFDNENYRLYQKLLP